MIITVREAQQLRRADQYRADGPRQWAAAWSRFDRLTKPATQARPRWDR